VFARLVTLSVLLLLCASPAAALTLAEITPLYFDEVPNGFSPASVAAAGRVPDFVTDTGDLFLGAGDPASGAPFQITSQVVSVVHQLPAMATPTDPAIVDSTWTIENVSAGALTAPLLLFTVLDPLDTYPGDPVIGLDADLLEIVSFDPAGADILYGAVALPDLAGGQSTQFTVRYVVAGPLQVQNASQLLAPMGLAVAATYTAVPEPSTLLLAVGGLLLTALCGRNPTARGAQRDTE
jgi:hypothetical protein